MIASILLGLQLITSPCQIPEVTGPVVCGTHRVWENRSTKQGAQIDLSIIVLKALDSNPKPDPVVFLQGGPGDAPSFNARFYSRVFAEIRRTRDLVLIDLRGTGKSGALTCPELAQPRSDDFTADILDLSGVKACRERLEKTHDLRQYTTAIAVDDLEEVRQALGFQQLNLYGTSYGTRVAQEYMRRYPASLRTVTMKGVVPPSMASPADHAPASEQAWRQLLKRCAKDDKCAAAYPNLESEFKGLFKISRFEPLTGLPPDNPAKARGIQITSGLLAETLRFSLYSPEQSARLPLLIKTLNNSNSVRLASEVFTTRMLLGGDRLAAGFFLSVSCTEDIPYLPPAAFARAKKTFAGDYRLKQQTEACSLWPRGEVAKNHRKPVKSTLPTLVISGEFDPVTPPSGGAEVLRTLSAGRHIVVKNNGHPIGSAEKCISSMIGELIRTGSAKTVDSSCAAQVLSVPFRLPQ